MEIQLTITINLISSTGTDKKRIMCSKSDNLDLISKETDEVIK